MQIKKNLTMQNIWISKISTNLVYLIVHSLFGSDTGICCKHRVLRFSASGHFNLPPHKLRKKG